MFEKVSFGKCVYIEATKGIYDRAMTKGTYRAATEGTHRAALKGTFRVVSKGTYRAVTKGTYTDAIKRAYKSIFGCLSLRGKKHTFIAGFQKVPIKYRPVTRARYSLVY